MTKRSLISTVGLALLLAACGRGPQVASSQLPLRRVVVYRNGVGYFERRGRVEEAEVNFRMRQHAVGDFLATLAIVERGGSTVRSASFPIEVEDKYEPIPLPICPVDASKCPTLPPEKKERNPLRRVSLRLDGNQHDLAVGYVAETPVWRPSYRVVMNPSGQAELQSWGIIQNLSGEDWKDVELVLVAGAPLAFRATLGDPVTPERPLVTDSGEVIAAVPEAVTSLEKRDGGLVNRYVPEEQPAPPPPAPAAERYAMAEDLRADGAGTQDKEEATSGGARLSKPMPKSRMATLASKKASLKQQDSTYPVAAAAPAFAPTPPMGLGGAMPSTPRNSSILAGVAVESGATRYSVPYPITVPDESATMVLLSSEKVPGEAVFLFSPDSGVSDSVKHPFRVARFRNATQGMLERGPIAVFEKGSFLGQGMLDSLPPGATATVPFALERGLAVEQSVTTDERGARLFKIQHGQLTIERDATLLTTYKAENGTKDPAKLLIRHPRRPGTRLFRPPPATEDNAAQGNALVPISVSANGKAELVVDERQSQQQSVGWLDQTADDAVREYLSDPRADSKAVALLKAAWQTRQTWKTLVDEQTKLVTERSELERNLQQLRSSLKAIEKNAQAQDLQQKLTRKLGDASTRLDQITKRLVEVELGMREQEVRFRDAITEVQVLSVPPPRD
jgi:hypothetical protein